MVFTYTKVTEMHDHGERGYEEEGYEFDYEPKESELKSELARFICKDYFGSRNCDSNLVDGVKKILADYDDFYESALDYYYDELKEAFADEAYDFEETTR